MPGRTILQVTPYYPPHLGGLENVVWQLAQQLGTRHHVSVVTTDVGASGAPRRAVEGSVDVRRHRAVELAHTPVAPGVVPALIRAPRAAVVHLHAAHAVLPEQVLAVAAVRRQPFFVHFHLDVDPSGRMGWLLPLYKRAVFGRVLRAASGVIVLSEEQARFVSSAHGVEPGRVFVVPNGVGDEYFLPARERTYGPLRLLFVGRLTPQKNVARLLEALSLVRENVVLDVVGDGEQQSGLRARAHRLGLTNVVFHGDRRGDDLVGAYARADAFVLPSDREGMSLAALEAMAASLPVVATDVPGNTGLLRGVGILVPPVPGALARAVDEVAQNEVFRRSLADASARASRHHSWDTVARRVEAVYDEVLG
jgi:glycosyltransferase involved in cell wall biosynthesis